MLKRIALVGVFFFASAISAAAITNAAQTQKTTKPSLPVPASPAPKGICVPLGNKC